MLFTDTKRNTDVGLVTLYLEGEKISFYYYSFYDLNYYNRNLGMYMMTSAVDYFTQLKYDYLYLGSCYSRNALYKTQFSGFEFFNGFRWSTNLKELKFMINRDKISVEKHLLETEEYLDIFYEGKFEKLIHTSSFRID